MTRIPRDKIEIVNELGRKNFTAILSHFKIKYMDCGHRIYAPCPIPTHPGDRDSWTSFCFDYSRNIWSCFSHHCETNSGNDVIGFVSAMKQCFFIEAFTWLKDFIENKDNLSIEDIDYNCVKRQNAHVMVIHKPLPENILSYLKKDYSYLLNRGFTREVIEKHQVGFWHRLGDFMHNRMVFPLRDIEGRLIGFTGRLVFEEDEWKKINPRKKHIKWLHGRSYAQNNDNNRMGKASVLVNLNNIVGKTDEVVIVEGPLDGLKLDMAGIYNWVACLGGPISPMQQHLLLQSKIKKVYLAFDADSAGRDYKKKTKDLLSSNFEVKEIKVPIPYDIGELSVSTIQRIFSDV